MNKEKLSVLPLFSTKPTGEPEENSMDDKILVSSLAGSDKQAGVEAVTSISFAITQTLNAVYWANSTIKRRYGTVIIL
jgi:hypothetical protein